MSEIVFNPQSVRQQSSEDLKSQIENLQTTLASLNQQVIILQESLQERDQQIADLKVKLTPGVGFEDRQVTSSAYSPGVETDETVTIVGALINLYNYVFLPGKAA